MAPPKQLWGDHDRYGRVRIFSGVPIVTRILLIVALIWPLAGLAGDLSERRAAADRYEAVASVEDMLNDAVAKLAQNVPHGQRANFIAEMSRLIDIDELRESTIASMAKIFTVEELDALADFYGSEVGRSITEKFGFYIADIMPVLNAQIAAAVEQLQ